MAFCSPKIRFALTGAHTRVPARLLLAADGAALSDYSDGARNVGGGENDRAAGALWPRRRRHASRRHPDGADCARLPRSRSALRLLARKRRVRSLAEYARAVRALMQFLHLLVNFDRRAECAAARLVIVNTCNCQSAFLVSRLRGRARINLSLPKRTKATQQFSNAIVAAVRTLGARRRRRRRIASRRAREQH